VIALVVIRGGQLPAGGAEAVAECDGRAMLVGEHVSEAVVALHGVACEIITVELGEFFVGAWSVVLAGALHHEPHVVLPASPDGRDLAPRLAAQLARPLYAGATLVTPDKIDLARRGGLVLETVHPKGPFVATLQPGIRGVDMVVAGAPTIRPLTLQAEADNGVHLNDAHLISVTPPDVTTMDLAEAPRIIGGGAGLDSHERFDQLARVSAQLGASVGATRVITDRHWIEHERQIGTTGVVVDPKLYLAFGVSGAVQHTSGLGNPEHIISVNIDPHCPMMSMADVAIVADANQTLEELERLLG
jgi:electron transfer flavoprotein alpha subunit